MKKMLLNFIFSILFAGCFSIVLAVDDGLPATFPIYITPSFETAGMLITQPDGQNYTSGRVYFTGPDKKTRISHELVKYDKKNLATSLFELLPATRYAARVVMTTSTGTKYYRDTSFTTRAKLMIPAAIRYINVTNSSQLQVAIANAVGGDQIRVAAGSYSAIYISNKHFTDARPLVIRALPGVARPRIVGDGLDENSAIELDNVTNVVISGFEIMNGGAYRSGDGGGGKGVYLRASSKVIIHNNIIHDNGGYNILISKENQYTGPGGFVRAGRHVILNNRIFDSHFLRDCDAAQTEACVNQAYYGIHMQNNPGAGTVIRGNTIYGHVDNISPCGNEKETGIISSNHVLAATDPSRSALYNNHDLEIYDNVLSNSRDDAIELDGVCVNARVYRNKISTFTNNVFSIAPALPGPYFILRNVVDAVWRAGAVKFNTSGPASEPLRNIYVYHNTFIRQNRDDGDEGAVINLWFDAPFMPLSNINFRNNIFYAKLGGRSIVDSGNVKRSVYPKFNYNLWSNRDGSTFGWDRYKGLQFSDWKLQSTQESSGRFTTNSPKLDVATYKPLVGSLAIDGGLRLPGINDKYTGVAPDIGAVEK